MDGQVIPSFFTASVVSKSSCKSFKPPVNYLILVNRGDDSEEPEACDIELSVGDSVDTFLLKYDEILYFGPSKYTKICYKRKDGTDKKIRLDIHSY